METTELLHVDGLTVSYGGNRALDDVSFGVSRGEILAIIGPNGAGKTTLLNAVSGIVRAESGKVALDGVDVTKMPFQERCRHGLGRTFQIPRAAMDLTLEEQVVLQMRDFRGAWRSRGLGKRLASVLQQSRLLRDRGRLPGHVTLGQYRLFELGRAAAATPLVLMVDEGASGMGYSEQDVLAEDLRGYAGRGLSVVLVEHNIPFVRSLADRVIVLNLGKKLAEGPPEEVLQRDDVRKAYLGDASA